VIWALEGVEHCPALLPSQCVTLYTWAGQLIKIQHDVACQWEAHFESFDVQHGLCCVVTVAAVLLMNILRADAHAIMCT
jgi:hypothetical protein